MGRLDGKVAIVTGVSSGMGKSTAILFAQEGAKVVMMARREEKLMKTYDEIKQFGGVAVPYVADISKPEDWKKVVSDTIEKFGKIDILVNNAAIGGDEYETEIGDGFNYDAFKEVIEINLYGTVFGIQEVVPHMKKNGGGSIINVSSMAAIDSCEGGSAYTASKGAISAFSRGLQRQVGPFGIRVNTILPGMIKTEMTEYYIGVENHPKLARCTPKVSLPMLFGEGIDIAYAMVYLASDESRYVTGAEIVIDGGYTCN